MPTDFSPSGRPSTSNPKLKNITSPQESTVKTPPSDSNAKGIAQLDPMVLWSAESDVPTSMLARPHTSNPRYVDGLMMSARESPARKAISPFTMVDTGAGVSPVNPSTPTALIAKSESNSNSLGGTGASFINPTAPVLWSDNGSIDPQLLARPVTANPWLQRVFDSVEKLNPPEEPLVGAIEAELEQQGTSPDALANVASTLSRSRSLSQPRERTEILWAATGKDVTDWRLLARPHSSNPILERSRQAKEEENTAMTLDNKWKGGERRPSATNKSGITSCVLWSRAEDESFSTHEAHTAATTPPLLQVASLQRVIEEQQAQMDAMRDRIAMLESLCEAAGILPPATANPSAEGNHVSEVLTLDGDTKQDPNMTGDVGVASSSSPTDGFSNGQRPPSAVPNDPAIRLSIAADCGVEGAVEGSVPMAASFSRRGRSNMPTQPSEEVDAEDGISPHLIRELANAERIPTPPPTVSNVAVNTTRTSAMASSPRPPNSPYSFGSVTDDLQGASPSPVATIRRESNEVEDGIGIDYDEDDANDGDAEEAFIPKAPSASNSRPKTAVGVRRGGSGSSGRPATAVRRSSSTTAKDNASSNDGAAIGSPLAETRAPRPSASARSPQQPHAALPQLADDDDEDAAYETFDAYASLGPNDKLINDRGLPQKAPTTKEALAMAVDPPHPNPRISAPDVKAPIQAPALSSAVSTTKTLERPRSANKVIPPTPPQITPDAREGRPSSQTDADIFIREDRGELSNEEEVERSFQKGYQRSPSHHVRFGGASAVPPAQYAYAGGDKPSLSAFHTGLGMPPRPESALPSRRAARLRMVVGQCRPTTAPHNRSVSGGSNSGKEESNLPQRPSTATTALAAARDGGSMVAATSAMPSARRCNSASLSRPFLGTQQRHIGSVEGRVYGKQRDQDIRKEYANILRAGEHAVLKDDFKALYLERASDFGMVSSDNDVEDLMAPFYQEGVDYLSLEEFGILFLKMSAW